MFVPTIIIGHEVQHCNYVVSSLDEINNIVVVHRVMVCKFVQFCLHFNHTSQKHTYIFLTPINPTFI